MKRRKKRSGTGRFFRKVRLILLTGMISVHFFFSSGLASVSVFAVGQQEVQLPAAENIICKAYLAYDLDTDEVLIGKDENTRIFPASMTKVMTAAIVLEYLEADEVFEVSQAALNATPSDSSLMGVALGEQVTVSELLYGLLLPSGNDAGNVLAEAVVTKTGFKDPSNAEKSKIDLFCDMMNQKAAELGLADTHYMNPHGFHDENHYTTAVDLAKVFKYAAQFEDFLKIISTPSHVFKATNFHTFDGWLISTNTNFLVGNPWMLGQNTQVAKVYGGKTGSTSHAGHCLVMMSEIKNGHKMVTVVAGVEYGASTRMATFMSAVVNAGANVCFQKDSEIRIEGDVITNAAVNKPDSWIEPTPVPEEIPPQVSETAIASEADDQSVPESGTSILVSPTQEKEDSSATERKPAAEKLSIFEQIKSSRVLMLAAGILVIAFIGCIIIIRQMIKGKR